MSNKCFRYIGLSCRWRALSACILAVSGQANASYACSGPVTYLGVSINSTVVMRVGGYGIWYVCNLADPLQSSDGNVIKPEACRAWYATLLANQKSGEPVTLYFGESGSASQCSQIGTWVTPTPLPYHLEAKNG